MSNAKIGYLPKVDLKVLVHLHDFFADYFLVPKRQIILENWLNLYNKRLVCNKAVSNKKYISEKKLLQIFYTKKNYIVYYQSSPSNIYKVQNKGYKDP